jgi:hypothetical protein
VRIVDGRGFDGRDQAGGSEVAVISANRVGRLFPDGHAVGRQFSLTRGDAKGPGTPVVVIVIGVAADTDTNAFGSRSAPRVSTRTSHCAISSEQSIPRCHGRPVSLPPVE